MVRRPVVLLSMLPVVMAAVAACGTASSGEPGAGAEPDLSADRDLEIQIQVDVMSGVPNPTWTARGNQAMQLVDRLRGLPDTGKGDATSALRLGFRGFVLRADGLLADRQLDQVRVLGTEIVATKPNEFTGRRLTDADRSVYKLLRAMSAEHLDHNIMQAIPLEGLKGST